MNRIIKSVYIHLKSGKYNAHNGVKYFLQDAPLSHEDIINAVHFEMKYSNKLR